MANIDSVVTKIISPKDELLQMMEPFDNMANQLGCAPMSISIMGQLCLIATEIDFDLTVPGATNNFEFLKYPTSFRASLCQVAQSGYEAFLTADSTMESIKLKSARVPDLLKMVLKILYGADSEPEDVQAFLPIKLGAIRDVADGCTKEADEVVAAFTHVIDLLSELECSTLVKQGNTKEAAARSDLKIKLEQQNKTRLAQLAKENEEELVKLKEEVVAAKEDWKTQMDKMPGIGSYLLGSLADCTSSIMSAATSIVSGRIFQSTSVISGATSKEGQSNSGASLSGESAENDLEGLVGGNSNASDARNYMYDAVQFNAVLLICSGYFKDADEKVDVSLDDKAIESSEEGVNTSISMIKILERNVKGKQGAESLKNALASNMESTHKLLQEISNAKFAADKSVIKDVHTKLQSISDKTGDIVSCIKTMAGAPQCSKPGPTMSSGSNSNSISGKLQADAHKKVEMARAELDSRRQAAEETNKRRMQTQAELATSMQELQRFEFENATQAEILKVIQKGLQAFAQLRDQWTELILFFKSIANLVKNSLAPELNQFMLEADKMSKMSKITKMAREVVYQSAFQAVKVAAIVNHLSSGYCIISREHLIPLNNKLFHLLALDRDDDKANIQTKRIEMEVEARKAHKAIIDIIDQKHREYKDTCDIRLNAIDKELKAIAPKPQDEVDEIKKKAQELTERIKTTEPDAEVNFDDYI